MDGENISEPNVSNYFLLLFQMQEKLQQLQSQLIGHEAAKKDLEKSLADKIDSESEEKQKLMQVQNPHDIPKPKGQNMYSSLVSRWTELS